MRWDIIVNAYWLNQVAKSPASYGKVPNRRFFSATSLPLYFYMNQYFADDLIIEQICKERVKLASISHKRQFTLRLAGHHEVAENNHPYYRLLPPRRLWSHYRQRFRKNSADSQLAALKRAVTPLRNQEPSQRWAGELNNYISRIAMTHNLGTMGA